MDAGYPRCADLAFVLSAVPVGVLPRLDHGLLGRPVDLAPGVVIALRLAENLLVTASSRHATLHSCHGSARFAFERLLVIGEKLLEAADIGVVHETRAAGARLAFDLAVLVAEIVAALGRVALEALGGLTKALGRGPVSLQLWHRLDSPFFSPLRRVPVGTPFGRMPVASPP